jgi:hypothetical protein
MVTRKTAKKPAAKRPATTAVKKTTATRTAKPVAKPTKAKALNGTGAKAPVKGKAKAAPKEKIKKSKLVRDSFTMPEGEYQGLGDIKKACLKAGFEVKKSELLRIGVALIRKMDAAALKGMLAALPPLKAGRPKKEK